MKRFIAFILILSCIIPFTPVRAEEADTTEITNVPESTDSQVTTGPEKEPPKPSYDSEIFISEDKKTVSATYLLTPETVGTYYLFRVTPDNEDISSMEPIQQADAADGKVAFQLEYNADDPTSVFYGYVLAETSESGYKSLTKARYIGNISDISLNNRPFFKSTSIKGLEVQYITDAQLIGVGQTVVHVKLNELMSNDPDESKSTSFAYGSKSYLVNNEVLTLLDYRIKTLTDAGINVHINYLLDYDDKADKNLYYPKADVGADKHFAPNVSTFDSSMTFAAYMHFIAERYSASDAKYGFCGSYILGYEVNDSYKNYNSGTVMEYSVAKAYSAYLRFTDLAVRSAYSEAKIYASVSNVWNVTEDAPDGLFGASTFITRLVNLAPDLNFGIAINPYPSDLQMTEFWLDEKATDVPETEYLTMKNLPVLQDYLNQKKYLVEGKVRSVIISEFGVSGVYGEESEKTQAAAYAYAFYNASRLPSLEAFIWHRHVDHNFEIGLSYGLYSSTELTLDRKDKKEIYDIFAVVDCFDSESANIIKGICSRLPVKNYEELIKDTKTRTRVILNIQSVLAELSSNNYDAKKLFDFSKSMYNFYPTDNTQYVEQVEENGMKFMRIASLRLTPFEHMGAGMNVDDHVLLSGAEYLTVKVRINASCSNADFVLMIDGNSRGGRATLQFTSTITTGTWITLKFPVHGLTRKDIADARIKIWARTDTSDDEQIFIDVASVDLRYEKNLAPLIMIVIIIVCGVISSIVTLIYAITHKKRKNIRWE